jgi:hypothetical protein
MGCKNCKEKKKDTEKLKSSTKKIFGVDRVTTWVIVGWFFLGIYGLWSLIEKIIHL